MRQGLLIALLGLLVTFASLGALALVMGGIGRVDRWRREVSVRRARERADRRYRDRATGEELPPERVAVIAAAITAFLGRPVRVRAVRYLRDENTVDGQWARSGRQEVLGSHGVVRRKP